MFNFSGKKLLGGISFVVIFMMAVVFIFKSEFFQGGNAVLPIAVSKNSRVEVPPIDRNTLTQDQINMLAMLEGFGTPDEEDIRILEKDSRALTFSASLKKLEGTLSKEMMHNLMKSALLAWFRQDVLTLKYESGEINMETFTFGLSMIVKIDGDFVKKELTDEQYFALMGESKSATNFELTGSVPMDGDYSEIISLFPALRNGEHPEIQSAEDLYKVIPREAIERITTGDKERLRINRESTRAFRLGKISQEEYDKQLEGATQILRDAINDAVTTEQEIFLFGYKF